MFSHKSLSFYLSGFLIVLSGSPMAISTLNIFRAGTSYFVCFSVNSLCHYYILLGSHRWKGAEDRVINLRNISDNWHIPIGQTPENDLLANIDYKDVKDLDCKRLSISLF